MGVDAILRARAVRIGDTLEHEIAIGDHRVRVDEPAGLGGSDAGPSPQELLAASLASCTAATVELYARHRGWSLGSVEVDVAYRPHEGPRRFAVELRISEELDDDQRRRIESVARQCPVRQTLTGEVVIEERLATGSDAGQPV